MCLSRHDVCLAAHQRSLLPRVGRTRRREPSSRGLPASATSEQRLPRGFCSQGSGCTHVDGSSVRVQWRAWKPQGPPVGGRRGVQSAAQGQCRPRHFLVTLDLMYFNGASSGPSDFLIITPSRQSKRSKVNCPFLLRFALNYYYYYF